MSLTLVHTLAKHKKAVKYIQCENESEKHVYTNMLRGQFKKQKHVNFYMPRNKQVLQPTNVFNKVQ